MPTKEGTPTGPSDPRSERSNPQNRTHHPTRSHGGVDISKPRQDLAADAREAGIEGRSKMSKEELAEALQRDNDRRTARARED